MKYFNIRELENLKTRKFSIFSKVAQIIFIFIRIIKIYIKIVTVLPN